MKKSNHSKIKNTAILFELLTRQVAADTIKGVDKSPALSIIKNFFKPNSLLSKELVMYQALINENYTSQSKASYLINTITKLRKTLPVADLKKHKYDIIKEIKQHYDLQSFFNTKITNYKLLASIYRLFEGASIARASEVVNSRFTIIEHLTRKNDSSLKQEAVQLLEDYKKQDEEVRMLAYKLMIDKFNDKYSTLSAKQKTILKEYINNVSNTEALREFVIKEALDLRLNLQKEAKKVNDKIVKIKLTEVINLTKKFEKIKTIKEENVLSLLMYHELAKELKQANEQ